MNISLYDKFIIGTSLVFFLFLYQNQFHLKQVRKLELTIICSSKDKIYQHFEFLDD